MLVSLICAGAAAAAVIATIRPWRPQRRPMNVRLVIDRERMAAYREFAARGA